MASDNIPSGGIATYSITVGGSQVPDQYGIYSIEIEKNVNRISAARIVVLDGDPDTGTFDASSSSVFVPGAQVVISAGYDTQNTPIFQGIITAQSLKVNPGIGSSLEVTCRDAAIKMTVGRKCLSFSNQSDSDIITSIIGNYSDLSSDVSSTTTQWPEQIQYYATDWDFIMARAEANGMIVTTLNNKVTVAPPDSDTTSVLTVQYGDNLHEFDAELNAVTQLGNVSASSWSYKTQAVTSGQSNVSYTGPGNLSCQALSQVVGLSTYALQTSANLEEADLTNWSKAQLVKSEYAKIMGTAKVQGTSLVDPGKYITLAGMGDRFNGDYLVSGLIHYMIDGNWLTDINLGMSPVWFTQEPDIMAPPASGLLPGVRGLVNGTVKQMYQDPDSQYRVLVNIPLFDPNGEGIWARLCNFYSTSGAGAFFMPEVGDEVVLGFLNEDPRYPVILGSVYSSSSNKPYTGLDPNQNNTLKAIVSKSGIVIQFDDENKVLTMVTPNKNTVVLSDQDQKITIQDQNSNSIIMSSSGIAIKSASNISIEADQSVSIKGNTGVTIEASGGDVQLSGINIKETADSQYSAMGGEMTKINAGMELQLQSAMIMIN